MGTTGWLDERIHEIGRRGEESAPDFITLDSGDGGSGAAPMPLMDSVGMPVRESLPLLVDKLAAAGLRDRVKVIASGKMIIPSEAAWAFCVGADFVNSARGFMFALGCIQAMRCNSNTCPTGVTTHNERLQRGLDPIDKADRVYQYAKTSVSIAASSRPTGARGRSTSSIRPRSLRRRDERQLDSSKRANARRTSAALRSGWC
jgi:glutamate synthase domain-containing protein 2